MNKILFIGAGNMGKPIVKSYLSAGFDSKNIKIVKPTSNNKISDVDYFQDLSEIPTSFQADIIFLAFKPQNAQEILLNIKNNINLFAKDRIFVSIIAGKNIDFLQNSLGSGEKFIRVMPNLPIESGEGLSLYFHKSDISNPKSSFILRSIGKIIKVEKENLINSLTPISGSGPALLFLFVKYLAEITQELGVSKADATTIVKQTIFGSAKMMNESDQDLETLICNVTSKQGVTAACLDVLRDGEFFDILKKSIDSGVKRAEKL